MRTLTLALLLVFASGCGGTFCQLSQPCGGAPPAWVEHETIEYDAGGDLCTFGMVNLPRGNVYDSLHETDMRLQATAKLASFATQLAQQKSQLIQERLKYHDCDKSRAASNAKCSRLLRNKKQVSEVIRSEGKTVLVGVLPGRRWENGRGLVYKQQCVSRANIARMIPAQ